ncbi:MAG: hypothetical protein EZS28_016444 [Streblomastix strix]|uniref:Uncharacterized protein n=1 Tax=Streblomastix strix TaxID=222440 RepID=A0A5J4W087_9EUKA|nr:MAG: hypothetical protein EZS28_016444 [Streblomastix strix]
MYWNDGHSRDKTELALCSLAQNAANLSEILKNVDFDKIVKNLRKDIEGNGEQKKKLRHKQKANCSLISALILGRVDDDLRQRIINAGISQALIDMFAYRDFDQINDSHMDAYVHITYPYTPLISQLLYEQKPFQPLLRVLDHNDSDVFEYVIGSIDNILYGIVMESNKVCVHPYYTDQSSKRRHEKRNTDDLIVADPKMDRNFVLVELGPNTVMTNKLCILLSSFKPPISNNYGAN